ncbi:MAG: DMT family transporter [Anaerolineae bacterium]|nr:DMT family transporter [Anaerolineae bacterium]
MVQFDYVGMFAALATAFLWALSSIFFSIGGKRVGSLVVNRIRLMFAVLWLLITHTILLGTPVPLNASPERWMWFSLSGIVGLAIGDAFLFQAYVLIGPRITTLFMASVPVISAFLGWIFFNEVLAPLEILGIAVTVGGIFLVVMDGNSDNQEKEGASKNYLKGVLFGMGAATGQAVGMALAKNGLTDGFPSLSGTLMRMIAAMAVIWLVTLFVGKARYSLHAVSVDRRALVAIMMGSIVGPFLGVWCSLIATQSEVLGIASTLIAMTPIFVLPIVYFVFKEKVTRRAVFGTVVALLGASILMLAKAGFFAALFGM